MLPGVSAAGRTSGEPETLTPRIGSSLLLPGSAGTPADPGSNSDDPILGVTVSGSPEVRPAALTPGSIAELLNRLLDSHVLHE